MCVVPPSHKICAKLKQTCQKLQRQNALYAEKSVLHLVTQRCLIWVSMQNYREMHEPSGANYPLYEHGFN